MITQIKNSIVFKPFTFFLALSISCLSFSNTNETITLKAGTIAALETKTLLNSEFLTVGKTIDFMVTQDIKVEGNIVVEAGAMAKSQVVRASRARGLGKAGYIAVEMKTLTAIDGSQILIARVIFYQEGKGKEAMALALGLVVCILFLTIKGENAIIPQGYSVTPSVAVSSEIEV